MNQSIIKNLLNDCKTWDKSGKSIRWLVRQISGHLSALEGPGPLRNWPNFRELIEKAWWGNDPVVFMPQNLAEVQRIVTDLEDKLGELLKGYNDNKTNIWPNK